MNTVYIIGAGASSEVNIPTGEQLKRKIAELLDIRTNPAGIMTNGNQDIYNALRIFSNKNIQIFNQHIYECQHISRNMPLAISIDNFLDSERGNEKIELCGKLAIVRSLLEAETNSKLYVNQMKGERSIDFSSLQDTWLLPFFRTIVENCALQDLPDRFSKITLIIFNYDRCVEHFLINALMSYYRLTDEQASQLLDKISFIHPYGMIGSLPWQNTTDYLPAHFGSVINNHELLNHSSGIRTFTQGAESAVVKRAHTALSGADRVIFLGFAFHRLNMEILRDGSFFGGRDELNDPVSCYATAHQTSTSDQQSIMESIKYLLGKTKNIAVSNTTCSKFFSDYSRSLGYN